MTSPSRSERPTHGDVWKRLRIGDSARKFSVMHVCGHHDPPHVTGYWWDLDGDVNPCLHSIPLPVFLCDFELVEREGLDD